ncbi:MAG TPA: efflux RND transporter periplasmic adaptor subunit, partial [Rhizomicrobium sp.]|nr:efflux RND transporter periplasmic adaptor subunit [Rhizomicrobium sp.]
MNEHKPSLDALRIDRKTKPPRSVMPLVLGLGAVLLLGGAGAATYVYWPKPSVSVRAVTAEARGDAAAGGGLDATGYVVARRMATISAKVGGRLAELNVEEGQRVEKGAVVARLDDSNYAAILRQAQARAKLARTALEDARPLYDRYQRLNASGAISTDALERQRATYNAARASLEVAEADVRVAEVNENDTVVRAPFSGVVTARPAQVGEIVAPSTAGGGFTRTGIATIVDMDTLEVEVDVSENYIDRVQPGGAATIVLDAYSDLEIPAAVIAVIPTADRSKGTMKVRVAIRKKDPRILPEMGARVSFAIAGGEARPAPKGVAVSREAVKDNGRTGTVLVIRQDNTLERREVTLGAKS